jgi:F-type H+-transporting ATPase subunit b
MLIDWFTVLAQALNFLILVWLMKHFLYKPILNAIDAREKLIANELADAAQKKNAGQKEIDEFNQKNKDFDHQRADLLTQATNEAKKEREKLLDEAKKDASASNLKQRDAWRSEAIQIKQKIKIKTQQEVFSIARKTLNDLAGMNLEERVIEVFVRKLHEVTGKDKDALISSLRTSIDPFILKTSFNLSDQQKITLENSIKELFTGQSVKFETNSDLISGIELSTHEHKIAWNIDAYLSSFENGVNELIKEKTDTSIVKEVHP